MKRLTLVLFLCVFSLGCEDVPKNSVSDADARQAAETKKRLSEADRQIGMPDITRFTERKLAKDILELRDDEITTYCYIVNLHGKLIFIGEAVGFGLPYSVQYTNPNTLGTVDGGEMGARAPYLLPQADPNGLFMPSGLAATWLMLKGPNGEAHPVYMEPEIIVSPFPLHAHEVAETDHVPAEVDGPVATEVDASTFDTN